MSLRTVAIVLLAAALCACAPNRAVLREAERRAEGDRDTNVACSAPDACAEPTPFTPVITRAFSGEGAPRHYVGLLDRGEDSLALRVHLIRSARASIDLQTFIFTDDDAGFLVLDELLAAARRGVRVRVLTDQLFSFDDPTLLAKLARAHVNFDVRVYNPTFGEARTAPLEFAAGVLCCWLNFNQRMHNKTMVVDDAVGITGGRNIDNRYFDWSDRYNYRDRDVIVVGPVAKTMRESFDAYWTHEMAVRLARLKDVAKRVIDGSDGPLPDAPDEPSQAERVAVVRRLGSDAAWIERTFVAQLFAVSAVGYYADRPNKPNERGRGADRDVGDRIAKLLQTASDRIVIQTPYLVLSKPAQRMIVRQRRKHPGLSVVVSTNSLAATDAFYVYALSYKYKRRYLNRLRAAIYEYKPFPGRLEPFRATPPTPGAANGVASPQSDPNANVTAPQKGKPQKTLAGAAPDAARTFKATAGAPNPIGTKSRRLRRREPVPLTRPGVRRSMHAKSIVIDGHIALIGSHNFDPRSDELNTEAVLVVEDAAFAAALEASIRIDIQPENAWVIAPRKRIPVVSDVNQAIARVSEQLPIFDLWPFRYATSYDLKPECQPVPRTDPRFHDCYEPVGDFPEVNVSLKNIYTRIITAFGAGLEPIL